MSKEVLWSGRDVWGGVGKAETSRFLSEQYLEFSRVAILMSRDREPSCRRLHTDQELEYPARRAGL